MEESGHRAVSKQPLLLEVVRQRIRLKHYSHRTEKSYVHWIECSWFGFRRVAARSALVIQSVVEGAECWASE
jgi:hypothetical protein